MNNTHIKFVLAVSFQNTTFQYLTPLVSDNRLPGAYFFSLYKGVVLKACKNPYFFLFKVEMLKLSIKFSLMHVQ